MYDAYRAPAVSLEHKQLLAWNMIMALSSHAAKEEMVLYPVVRSTLGPVVADQLTNEHSTVKQLLAMLDTMSATDPGFDMQLRASLDNMIAHMQEEESTVLPQLAAVLSAEAQLQLGIQFEASKVRAPTRPHPEAANLAPFNEVAFAAAKQVDVALDQVTALQCKEELTMPYQRQQVWWVGWDQLVVSFLEEGTLRVAAANVFPPCSSHLMQNAMPL
eukprot:gene7151-7366_t